MLPLPSAYPELREPRDCLAEAGADLLEHRRGGDRHATVIMQERHHLTAYLQQRHVPASLNLQAPARSRNRQPRRSEAEPHWVIAMQYSRQHVVNVLHRLGYTELADEASRDLPDPVDINRPRHGASSTAFPTMN